MRKSSEINSKETGNVKVPLSKSDEKQNKAEKIRGQMDETTTEEEPILTIQTTPALTTEEDQTLSFTATDYEITESPDVFGSDVTSILIYAAPAIILVLLIPIIILIVVRRKRRKKQQEVVPIDDDVKSPIFEEDTPSVMEIEMDDLDKWMSNMKNSCRLSTLEEENKTHTSTET